MNLILKLYFLRKLINAFCELKYHTLNTLKAYSEYSEITSVFSHAS